MKKLKIAIVTDWLVKIGGAEKVLLDLIKCYPEADIYTSVFNPKLTEFQNQKIYTSWIQKIPFAYKFYKLFFGFMPKAFESFDFSEYDIVINSNWALSKCILTDVKTMHIAYMHNPTRYLWADSKDYFERSLPKFCFKILQPTLHKLRTIDFLASQRIDCIISNSKTVQKRIHKYYRRKSTVVHPATDTIYEKTNKIEKGEYYVALGRLKGFKRFDLIIKTFNELDKKLIIIGDGEQKNNLQKMCLKNNIKFLGRVSNKIRNAYLQHAKGMIFPQEEDFGITILDSLVNQCPVIAYQKGGAKEILNKNTAIFFKEQNVASVKKAIMQLEKCTLKKSDMTKLAQSFTQKTFQEQIKKTIKEQYELHQKKYCN